MSSEIQPHNMKEAPAMKLLGKNDIFATDDRRYELVQVDEWGGVVRIRSLTGAERDEFEKSTTEMKNGRTRPKYDNFRARYCALCIVDEQGVTVFNTRAEINALGTKSASALQKVFNKAQELNGMSEEDVEELTEGFEEGESEPSTSVSLSPLE